MRAVRYHEGGAPSVLRIDEIDRPTTAAGEILIEVRAASVNPVDAKRRQWGAGILPKTTGSDFAGVVAEVGPSVDEYAVGDRVFGTGLHAQRFQQGSFADYVSVPLDTVAPLPDSVSFTTGAGVALVGVTEFRALVQLAVLEPGETVLVHGGSGGVGHVAVQLAASMGGEVTTTVSQGTTDTVLDLGADTVIEYDRPDLMDAVKSAFGSGADVILDHRFDDYLQFDIDVASFDGRIVIYGGNEGSVTDGPSARGKELTIHWLGMSNIANRLGTLPSIHSILTQLAVLLEHGDLTVEVAQTYNLTEAAAIHRAVMNESYAGKLILTP